MEASDLLAKLEPIVTQLNNLLKGAKQNSNVQNFKKPPESMSHNSLIEQVRRKVLEYQGQQISARKLTKAIWVGKNWETQDYYNRYVSGILSRWVKDGHLKLVSPGRGTRRAIYEVPTYGSDSKA